MGEDQKDWKNDNKNDRLLEVIRKLSSSCQATSEIMIEIDVITESKTKMPSSSSGAISSMLLGVTLSTKKTQQQQYIKYSSRQQRSFLLIYTPILLEDHPLLVSKKNICNFLHTLMFEGEEVDKKDMKNNTNEITRGQKWIRKAITVKECSKRLISLHSLYHNDDDIFLSIQQNGVIGMWHVKNDRNKYMKKGHNVKSLLTTTSFTLFDEGNEIVSSTCMRDVDVFEGSNNVNDFVVYMLMWVQRKEDEKYLCRVSYMKVIFKYT